MMNTCPEHLELSLKQAQDHLYSPFLSDTEVLEQTVFVARNPNNRAAVRFLMACLLAKIDRPEIDPRKPYTEIAGSDSFSGRFYDETYVQPFVRKHKLPCNPTTAFLTPAFRNINQTLTTDVTIAGRPPKLYYSTLRLLDEVYKDRVTADILLVEVIRQLILLRDERAAHLESLITQTRQENGLLSLSAEGIVDVIARHLQCKNASRLPVLVVAAAYAVVQDRLGERALPLNPHNAADEQTGALGDIEIALLNDDQIVTCYEMKMKEVTKDDIDRAVEKIVRVPYLIGDYIFVTNKSVSNVVQSYAASIYESSGGTEVVVLDCIGFVRHFLHLFHRARLSFLDCYQSLLLAEPDSAASPALKEAFLVIRHTAEQLLTLQAAEEESAQL